MANVLMSEENVPQLFNKYMDGVVKEVMANVLLSEENVPRLFNKYMDGVVKEVTALVLGRWQQLKGSR